jgi:hypothetical protein
MVLPLLYAGVMIATTAGRVAIPIVARYIIKHGAKKAAKKYGTKIVSNTKIVKQVKQIKNVSTKTVKGKKPVKFVAKSAKQKNIAKKIAEKTKKKLDKVNPRKKIQAKKTTDTKLASPKTTKTKSPPSRTDLIKKVDKKATTKSIKNIRGGNKKPAKVKDTKTSKIKDTKTSKIKDTKTSKAKDTKKVDKKVDKKSLATKSKTSKIKDTKASKIKDTKKVSKKVDKKSLATKSKISKIKTKKPPNIPLIVGGTVAGGLIATALYNKKKNKKAPNIPKGLTPPSVLNPKPSTGSPRTKDGMKEVERRKEDAIGSAQKSSGPKIRKKLNTDRSGSYESRIRALVSKKDALTKIESGDGRSEYQVRINKLKKENPKAFKKMFKLGGFGNLKESS